MFAFRKSDKNNKPIKMVIKVKEKGKNAYTK